MSLQQLVAHYLAANYPSVAQEFCAAAQLAPPDLSHPPNPDLRTLVEDYLSASVAKGLERVEIEEEEDPATDGSWRGWKGKDIVKIPLEGSLSGVRRSISGVSASNLLTVGYALVPYRRFDTSTATYHAEYKRSIITTAVDKNVYFIDYTTGEVDRLLTPHRAAVLSFGVHPTNPRYILTSSMDGTTVLTDLITLTTLQTFKSSKFVVRVAFSLDGRYFATASYDRSIVIYGAATPALARQSDSIEIDQNDDLDQLLDETDDANLASDPTLRYNEVLRLPVESNPEALLFTEQYLIYTLRSSPLLHYLHLGTWEQETKSLNPHQMDNHQSFAVLHLALHPSGKVFAAQTGDHRGGAGERILIYGVEPGDTERLACLWTGGEVDDFVLPRMAWLPDGSGLITTTPNGYLNLISLSGEVRSSVKIHGDGEGSSSVVRDCVVVPTPSGDWEVVSVGYDRQVRFSR